jgi:Xaa-Pro aminopeptidase
MRFLCLLGALLAAHPVVSGPSRTEFRTRRVELAEHLHDGVLVLFGGDDKGEENLRTGFFQEANFFYLSGWREPGAILLVAPQPEGHIRDMLFLPRRDPTQEKWTGPKADPSQSSLIEFTGFDIILPVESFENELHKQLETYSRIYTAGEQNVNQLKALASLREVTDVSRAIARLRMRKSPEELALIQHSIDVTLQAHRAAWKRATAGLYEYQVAATMTDVYFDAGCERSAYAPIVGAGPDSTILHYSRNSRRIDRGELLLMDVGAECAGYAADITRTIPVDAPFSSRQKEIYNVVLGAQNAAIAAVKPGVTLGGLTQIARDYMDSHGHDLHGEKLGKYFIHGIGHHVGLDVHDASDVSSALAPGNVITIEPGLYIPEENIGVRIEDMVLVTKDGGKLLSAALPRDPAEIEKALGR